MKKVNTLDAKELARILRRRLDALPEFTQILQIATLNTSGNIWLIGGAVSRTLANELYDTPRDNHDYDIICEFPIREPPRTIDGWHIMRHKKFGSTIFRQDNHSLDLWHLAQLDFIVENHLEPTLDNFLKGVPFTIQALAYNLKTGELIGEAGINALRHKVFAVNNQASAQAEAKRKGVPLKERMQAKAESMGFILG